MYQHTNIKTFLEGNNMRKKSLASFLIAVVFVMSSFVPVSGADEISVFYNGEKVIFDVLPAVIDGRTLVPMRAIFEAFGASVTYDPQTKQIISVKGSLTITLNLGNTYATISKNGVITEAVLEVPPFAADGRTFVPLRFIGEALGAAVNWNGATKTVSILLDEVLTATEIAEYMAPRSVIINCYDSSDEFIGQGSGFFITSDGNIVTAYHVVEDADKVMVTLDDGSVYEGQDVIHWDKDGDLIVFNIGKSGVPVVEFGDSSLVKTGNSIYTYGSPLGISNTISEGIVSNKSVEYDGYTYLQISAPVSPGSSGGCVIDGQCKVIGIIIGSFEDGQNMNLSVPVNALKALLRQEPLVYEELTYGNDTYSGYTLDGKRHFLGTYTWESGNVYSGEWQMDELTGHGLYYWASGNDSKYYLGDFVDSVMHGFGIMLFYNGDGYIGDWDTGMRTGFGYYEWANGDIYEGDFLNDNPHGYGVMTYSNGTVVEGHWEMGVYTGP
jgi:S1-C subfamily serine protease